MKMRNEDMVDPSHFESEFSQLYLGAFPTIDQEKLFIKPYNLRGGKSLGGRKGRAASEDSN